MQHTIIVRILNFVLLGPKCTDSLFGFIYVFSKYYKKCLIKYIFTIFVHFLVYRLYYTINTLCYIALITSFFLIYNLKKNHNFSN